MIAGSASQMRFVVIGLLATLVLAGCAGAEAPSAPPRSDASPPGDVDGGRQRDSGQRQDASPAPSPPDGSGANTPVADAGLPTGEACQPTAHVIEDIYFDDNPSRPWMSCYTIPVAQAAEKIRRGEIPGGGTMLALETTTVSGTSIFVQHRDGSWPNGLVELQPCVFTKADSCAHRCVVTFQDAATFDAARQRDWVSKEQACAAAHPELAGRYVSCQAGVLHAVTNTWGQPIARQELKLMQHLLGEPRVTPRHDLVVGATGGVTGGGSLEACMGWSAELSFTFAQELTFPAGCDSSLWTMGPEFGTWCPAAIQIVRVVCDGYPTIVNPRAPHTFPLDRDEASARGLCGGDPS